MEKLSHTKRDLDAVSPSFCLAKWLQVTLHLQNGFNHSCHHPDLHQTPLDELEKDPSALHNTAYKKQLRAAMIEGKRPKECAYCWKVEDSVGNHFSDRVLKSSDEWARPRLQEVVSAPPDRNVNPSYVEVSFGHECNFRCSYCGPDISSSIWSQYQKHGPYVGRNSVEVLEKIGRRPYAKDEVNPYVNAFWEWFPELSRGLRVFRITGGEPLINPNTFHVLEYIEKNPLPHLELCVNSNLGIPDKFLDDFLKRVESLVRGGKLGKFMLYTSMDTHGSQAEYIRKGLRYERWLRNVRRYLTELPTPLTFMVTFNVMSVPRFQLFLEDVLQLNKEFLNSEPGGIKKKRTLIDISHLLHPEYFSAWLLPPKWRSKVDDLVAFMNERLDTKIGPSGFYEYETHKMRRIQSWISSQDHESIPAKFHRARFFLFTSQFEEREGQKFLDIFPEMESFYLLCKADSGHFVNGVH